MSGDLRFKRPTGVENILWTFESKDRRCQAIIIEDFNGVHLAIRPKDRPVRQHILIKNFSFLSFESKDLQSPIIQPKWGITRTF